MLPLSSRLNDRTAFEPHPAARGVAIVIAALGAVLVVAALAATQTWLDRHFLPSFFLPRQWYMRIETVVRAGIGVMGVCLVFRRRPLARRLTRSPGTTLRVVVAALLAVAAGEAALRWIHLRPTEWLVADEEPRRQDDERLGWVLVPGRTGRASVSGRTVEYAIDAAGYRVHRVEEAVDPDRPALVFAGESVMFGEGLTWEESIPAQVSAMLGIQAANLGVHGYSTDQMYLRLDRELPRFRRPVAVVAIFMAELFGRNLDADRPHLGPGLVWQHAEHASRLRTLAKLLVPFRRDATVERGLGVTRDVFYAMRELTRTNGAPLLIIVPQFGTDDHVQRALRDRVLPDDGSTVFVPLDSGWRLAWDRHPNAHAAHVIATAVAARLRLR